jgi:alkylation response protein AidB-like acyl-CoA dehydrogenase
MAQRIADRRDIDFVLFEQLGIESLFKTERYRDLNRKLADMVITEARRLGINEILPTYAEGDRTGVTFENGQVKVPPCFYRPYKYYVDGDWIAMEEDPAMGGQGLPQVVAQAAREYIVGANFAFAAFGILAHGTGKMIELFGTEAQKKLFLKKVYSGEWAGTMLLTEPEAGSDVGALTTTARPNPDGTYSITGNKIFITCGDHDVTANIIHPVLARIEGAPVGTKGISIFLVPKRWVNEDGSLGDLNDIVCTGIEEKMGIHGSPTCSMALGSRGTCRGLLLGEANRGMAIMFHMMNEARLGVGQQGYLHGSSAYLHAAEYAKQRVQGRDLSEARNPQAAGVPIIRHPDIRRQLMRMKALVDGMRSFTFYVAYLFDLEATADDSDEKEKYKGLIEFLTPVVKAYCSDRGMEICDMAMNVFGGYGYTREYPVEQLMRDCKIATIYEGTNGIQAMDLLGRKLGLKKGEVFMQYLQEIRRTIQRAETIPVLQGLCGRLEQLLNRYGETAIFMGKKAMSPEFKIAFTQAQPFLDVTGDIIMAWMLLWRAAVAQPRLAELLGDAEDPAACVAANKEAAFYDGQIRAATYFIRSQLPVTEGKINAILDGDAAAILDAAESSFGG